MNSYDVTVKTAQGNLVIGVNARDAYHARIRASGYMTRKGIVAVSSLTVRVRRDYVDCQVLPVRVMR